MNIPKRIMLIDDDTDDQLFFQEAVQAINPAIYCKLASNCQEAINQLVEPPSPDLIFLDLNMPVMNGFDCLVYLKNQNDFKDIPVIIFTTSRNSNDINRTKQLGAKWFMTKPDNFNVLCTKLNKIIQKDSIENQFII
jgi:CheY-like chemotaxis protein